MYSNKLCFFFLFTTFITGSLATPLHKHFHHHHGTGFHHFCTEDGSGDIACSFPNGVETTFFAESATSIATDTSALSPASANAVDSTPSLAFATPSSSAGLSSDSVSQSMSGTTTTTASDVTSTVSPADVSSANSAEVSTTAEALNLTATATSITTLVVTSPPAVVADSTSVFAETSQSTTTSTSAFAVTSELAAAVASSSSSTSTSASDEASISTSATTTTSASVVDSAVAAAVTSSSSSTSSSTSSEASTSTSTPASTSISAGTSAVVAAISASRSAWSPTSTASLQSTSATTSTSSSASPSTSTSTIPKSTSATTATSNNTNTATGTLPAPSEFEADNGTKWTVEYVGEIGYTGPIASQSLGGDKCRTSKIGDQIMWNCGDMECGGSWTVCGFSMGPSFYGTDDVLTINTTATLSMNSNGFMEPWSNDPAPVSPWSIWGMDTSNVAAINDTHGVAYAWEIWRGAADGSVSNRGNAVASITLGDNGPVATRVGPLLTGPDSISLGLLAILADGGYIYTYTIGGPTNLIIGRVAASDDVFDANQYEFLAAGSTDTWIPGIPSSTDTSVAATTANTSGSFGCGNYGSVFFNKYLNKYVILCDIFTSFVNMYVADNPWGPWSAEYGIQGGGMIEGSYGAMAHPEYAVDGDDSGKSFYYSLGPNGAFYMFKLTFDY